jgi:OOP family OmpA-OmpF porin
MGIELDRIEAQGYGEKQPKATNETPEGRAKNRRTEVRISIVKNDIEI